jgi:transcriptional regulator with XRE-family HTH domain
MDKAQLGAFIAERRKALGMRQKDLADRLHVTDKAVSKWERGLSYPDVTLLEPLADTLGLNLTELASCTAHAEAGGETREEQAMKNVLQLSADSVAATRKKGRRWIAVLAAACLLLAAVMLLLTKPVPLSDALSLKWGTRVQSATVTRAGTADSGPPITTRLDNDRILLLEACLRDGSACWRGLTKKTLVWNAGALYTLCINYNNGRSATYRVLNGMLYTDTYAYRLEPETAAMIDRALESVVDPIRWALDGHHNWKDNAVLFWREGQYDIAGPLYTGRDDTAALRQMVTARIFAADEEFTMKVMVSSDWLAGGAGRFIVDGLEYTYYDTGELYCDSTLDLAAEPLTEEELSLIRAIIGGEPPETPVRVWIAPTEQGDGFVIHGINVGADLTVTLPESWQGRISYEVYDSGLSVYCRATRDETGEAGRLFWLEFNPGWISPDFPFAGNLRVLAANRGYHLLLGHPSDVQWTPDTKEEYDSLYADIDQVQVRLSDEMLASTYNETNWVPGTVSLYRIPARGKLALLRICDPETSEIIASMLENRDYGARRPDREDVRICRHAEEYGVNLDEGLLFPMGGTRASKLTEDELALIRGLLDDD